MALILINSHNSASGNQDTQDEDGEEQQQKVQDTDHDDGQVEIEEEHLEHKMEEPAETGEEEEEVHLITSQDSDNGTDVVQEEQDEEGDLDQTDLATDDNSTAVNATDAPEEGQKLKYSPRRVLCKQRVFQDMEHNGTSSLDASGKGDSEEEEEEEGDPQQFAPVEEAPTAPLPIQVKVVNGSQFARLLSEQNNSNVTNRSMAAQCSLGFFYASWCPFSAAAAPHFNALPRLFPDLDMLAVDTGKHHGINAQFGVLALPTIILFHNSKAVAKYNLSEYQIGQFANYVTYFTGLEPQEEPVLLDQDYEGPVPTVQVPVPDYYLYLAWAFIVVCALGYFFRSSLFMGVIDTIRRTWQEAEIHHEHED